MKLKCEVYEALLLLSQWDGVPPTVICDNDKEMVLGQFSKNFKEASCHKKQMGPFIPWSYSAKRERIELKKDFSKKLIMSHAQRDIGMNA